MAFRFVHTADVHLDSPLQSLALRDPEIAEMIGNATRQAFERTVALCLEERVDALMIAGDLYDGDLRSMKTAVFFGSQMRRLTEAGIRVFIIRGNHDAESKITKHLSLPEGVHVFTGRAEAVRIEGQDVVVHGISFAEPQAPESLLPKFKAPVPGSVNIGLLHTSLAGAEGHDTYAPCSLADLTGQGFDYWGLGHIHKRQVHAAATCTVVMPGIPQGRHIGEDGPRSVTLVTIAEDGRVDLEERVTSIAQFERVLVEVTGLTDWPDVVATLEMSLRQAREAAVCEHLVARLEVAGTTPLASRLRRDADWLLDEARQVAASLSGTAVEKISIEAQSPARPEKAADYDPVSELQDLIAGEVLGSETFRAEVRAIVTDLQQRLPPELRDSLGESEQAIEETIARVILEGGKDVLARLEGVEPAS